MELVEGVVHIGDSERFPDVDTFINELDTIAEEYGVTAQAFDARYVVSRRHLERALELADRERARDVGIARDRAVEVLLYAAGRRQIDQALELGVDRGELPVVVLLDAAENGNEAGAADVVTDMIEPATTLGNYDENRVRAFYNIEDAELMATGADLEALVLERLALLVVNR